MKHSLYFSALLATIAAMFCGVACGSHHDNFDASAGEPAQPNVILIFADDQGYGDLGCFGSKLVKTPNIDRMAKDGMRFTNFYSAASVCTPSRAALMTGCYPERVGNLPVLFPNSDRGLNPDEQTVAELLRDAGYRTACFGKWHLGHHPEFLPTNQGFDEYWGIPYSNDMRIDASMKLAAKVNWRGDMTKEKFEQGKCPGPPIMRGSNEKGCEVIEAPADQTTLTKRYTEKTLAFISESKQAGKPFFVYLPHTMPHIPLYASDAFRGKSESGLYGDTLEEMDHSVGQILQHLKDENLDQNTIVVYTSDNGPWKLKGSKEAWVKGNMNRRVGGSAGPLRGFKFSRFEGGMREPTVIWGPGIVAKGKVCDHMTGSIDLLPTFIDLAKAKLPNRKIDGKTLKEILEKGNEARPVRDTYFYRTEAVRVGEWKLKGNELFNLKSDIGESKNLANDHPDIVAKLTKTLDAHKRELKNNRRKPGHHVRPAQKIKDLPDWKGMSGDWALQDSVLKNASPKGEDFVLSATLPESDFELTVKARKTKGGEGVRLRIRANHYQYLRWSLGAYKNTQHSLMRVQGKNVTKRSEPVDGKMEIGRWYELKLVAKGQNIKCFVDGELIHDENFNWQRTGMIGLGSHQACVEFKDLKITQNQTVILENWKIK